MKKSKKIILLTIIAMAVLLFIFSKIERISPLSWGHGEVNQPMFSEEAINGYDAVSYFTNSKAIAGSEEHVHTWKNATWHFSSEENKALFVANPEQYAPQFGGYCAFAVSKGFTANTDPNSFAIIDNQLFLFADDQVKKEWMADQTNNLAKCKSNW